MTRPQPQSARRPPVSKPTSLIVLMAFIRDEDGELQTAFEPREVQSEHKAKMDARRMAARGTYAGVITWLRSADLVIGEFGEPMVLYEHDDVPEME